MSKTPIDMMLDGLEWKEVPPPVVIDHGDGDVPYATHSGVLEIAGKSLRCYRLSNGQAVFHADDLNDFFDFA